MRKYYSPDIVCEFVGHRARIPYAGRHVGVEAVINIVRGINVDFEQLDNALSDILVDGGRLACRRTVQWRHRGTGRRGLVELAEFVTIRGWIDRRAHRISRQRHDPRNAGRVGSLVKEPLRFQYARRLHAQQIRRQAAGRVRKRGRPRARRDGRRGAGVQPPGGFRMRVARPREQRPHPCFHAPGRRALLQRAGRDRRRRFARAVQGRRDIGAPRGGGRAGDRATKYFPAK